MAILSTIEHARNVYRDILARYIASPLVRKCGNGAATSLNKEEANLGRLALMLVAWTRFSSNLENASDADSASKSRGCEGAIWFKL